MGKIAFVFAGQGAQYPGMGWELSRLSRSAAAVFRQADELRPGTSAQCFEGSEEELRQTANTQPCMFAVEMAAAAVLSANGVRAQLAAGFSLGELAALTYAKSCDFETGFRLVCSRGRLMQAAAEEQPAAMVAVLRLPRAELESLCARFEHVYPVNYNCPGQITVAGQQEELISFSAAVKEAGARAVPLKVTGGFHSPFMASAGAAFAAELATVTLKKPAIPLYANRTGEPYGDDVAAALAGQICAPVQWERSVRNLIAAGADTFIELGPGQTLCSLIAKTDSSVRTYGLAGADDLHKILTEVRP